MKKLSRLILGIVALFMMLSLSIGEAKAAEIIETGECGKDATYTLDSDGVLVISGTGTIESPMLNNPAFPKKVIIEEGIEIIGEGAFCEIFTSIEAVELPSTITFFGELAFEGTPWRAGLEAKDGLIVYKHILISVSEDITKVTIPEYITVIGGGALEERRKLEEITLHNGIIGVGADAFHSLENVSELKVPRNLKTIEFASFRNCQGVKNVNMAEGLKKIYDRAFMECYNLKTVTLPSTVESIYSSAFEYCSSLETFQIYSKDVVYGEDVFKHSDNVNIICRKNSTTEAYAKEYNIPYQCFYYVDFANTAGTKVETRERLSGEAVGTLPTLKRTGYNFKGWYTAKTGGTKVTSTTKITKDTTLYAQWEIIKPGKVTGFKQGAYSTKYIKMSWNPVSGATGYYVYRKDSASGTYKKIATTTKTSYTNKNLKAGVKYYYIVKAYKTLDGVTVTGTASAARTMITRPGAPKIKKISPWTKRATVFWSGVSGADGYEVYMSTSKTGTYKKIATCTAAKRQYRKTGLKSGKKYYFKIKSYKLNAAGKKVYSYSYSKAVSVVVK